MMKRTLMTAMVLSAVICFTAGICVAEELQLLTWSGYAPKVLLDKFKSETGIDVKVTLSNNEEMIAKLRATRGAGFDLAQPSQDRITSVQKKFKIYQPIDYSKVNTDQIIPAMVRAMKQNTAIGNDIYGVPHVFGTSGLIVNKKFAADAKSFSDLLNPAYKGRVSYRLKRATLIGLAFASGTDPFAKYGDVKGYSALMDKIGKSLIDAKPVVKNYWTNGDALLQSMLSNEVHLAMGWEQQAWKLNAENPDIDYVAPESGSLAWIDTFAIPAKAKNTAAAYKWINFSLRPDNAAIFTNKEKYGTASKDAVKHLDASVSANFKRCFPPAVMDNMKWYPPVPAKLESIEGKILDKVKAAN